MDKQQIYEEVSELLVSLFELSPDQIYPEASLYEDLDLDSIDAVDMVVHLQKKTGKKFSPKEFETVRTVQDVVNAIEKLFAQDQA